MHADNAPLRLKVNTQTYSKHFRDGLGGIGVAELKQTCTSLVSHTQSIHATYNQQNNNQICMFHASF